MIQLPLAPVLPDPVHLYRNGVSRNTSEESLANSELSLTESNTQYGEQAEQAGNLFGAAFDRSRMARMDSISGWSNDKPLEEEPDLAVLSFHTSGNEDNPLGF